MKGAKPKMQETKVIPNRMKFRWDIKEVVSRTWVERFALARSGAFTWKERKNGTGKDKEKICREYKQRSW